MPTTLYGHCELGVDYSTPPHELLGAALADSKNVVPNDEGLIVGRGGQVKFNNTTLSDRVTSFFELRNGATRKQLASYGTKIGEYSTGTGEFVDKITGLTDDKMTQWVNFGGKAISVNEGADPPQYWDGSSGGNLAGSPPHGQTIAEWSNRLWFGTGAVLGGSKLNDPTDYTGAGDPTGAISQTVGDSGDNITALFGFFNWLLIGKKNTIYRVSGNPATDAETLKIEPLYSRSQETDSVGFTSPWAITQVGNDVLFLDGFDIKSLTGIQEFGDVKHLSIIPHVRDYLKSICDKDLLQYSQFFHYKKEQLIWVSMPTSSSTNFVFILSYKFKEKTSIYSFYPMGEIDANVFGGVENGVYDDVYFGDNTGFVKQLDTGNNDDGGAIERYFTKVFAGNYPENGALGYETRRKNFKNSETFIKSSEATLTMEPSYLYNTFDSEQVRDASYTALNTQNVINWDGLGAQHSRVPLFGVSGKAIALKWLHETINENFIFYPSKVNFSWKKEIII